MPRPLTLPGWAIHLLRRALYFWVRTSVFPEHPQELGIDPAKPVCYVLQDEHLSDQLVLYEETRRAGLPSAAAPLAISDAAPPHAFFFLARRHSRRATARQRHAPPALMTALIGETLSNPDFDVQIVPVIILWGRSPDKQESILKALFSETWQHVGRLGRLLTILLHGRNVLVRFSAPISLHGFSAEGLDSAQGARKLARVLRVHFRRQREIAIGPDLSHRNTQIETLLNAPAVRAAIDQEAATHGVSFETSQGRARRFALEIASDYSYGMLRALKIFFAWLWAHLYDGIEIHNIDSVARIAPDRSIVYIPAHRSHIDYLVLSYFLHEKGLTPPHIAAGANLNMPLIGPLLRRCGAFFLRRSFKGEALYAAVFNEYLHLMLTRGFPLEYFIEGGRSRSGRTLNPKAGILGMTLASFIRARRRPLVFVPVYLGYEKLLEGKTYLRELAGKPKEKESVWAVLQSVRKIRKIYGRVHVNFGEAMDLDGFLAACRPGWQNEPPGDWVRDATRQAATALATRLNDAAVLTPINLMALTLLATPKGAADEQALLRMLAHYQALAQQAPYSPCTISCPLDPPQIVAYAVKLGSAQRLMHPLGDLIRIVDGSAPLLTYFRNNVLHLFALPALIACLVGVNRQLPAERMMAAIAGIYGLMRRELFLRWSPAELPAVVERIVSVLCARGLLQGDGDWQMPALICAPAANSPEFVELCMLGETLRPSLERHFLALSLLQQSGSGRKKRRQLEDECQLLAQRLALLHATDAPEYSEKSVFSVLIGHLVDSELLQEDESGLLYFDEPLTEPLAQAELVLPAETRQAIRRMAGAA